MRKILLVTTILVSLSACAGRDPRQIAVVQPQDAKADCTAIQTEIQATQYQIDTLKREESNTRGGNIALGVAGAILFWPALFAMDFKDAAGKEMGQQMQRLGYLQQLFQQKGCASGVVTYAPRSE